MKSQAIQNEGRASRSVANASLQRCDTVAAASQWAGQRPVAQRLSMNSGETQTEGVIDTPQAQGRFQMPLNNLWAPQTAPVQMHRPFMGRASGATESISTPVIQRNEHDNADEFIAWIKKQTVYQQHVKPERGHCVTAAAAIGAFLEENGFAVTYRGILLYDERAGRTNANHIVVLVTLKNGEIVVVDSTQGQFEGGNADGMVSKDSSWRENFQNLMVDQGDKVLLLPSKYKDCGNFEDARTFLLKTHYRFAKSDDGASVLVAPAALPALAAPPAAGNGRCTML